MAAGGDRTRFLKGGLLVIGILILGGVMLMFSHNKQQATPGQSGIVDKKRNATIGMEGGHHTDIRNGVKEWELDYEYADYWLEENRAYLSMLQATFFKDDGEQVFLSAESGTWMTDSNDLEVNGNVVLKNSQCEMQTDRLIFNEKKQIFVTESPVTLTIPAFSLHREYNSMTYSLDTEIITLDGNEEVPF